MTSSPNLPEGSDHLEIGGFLRAKGQPAIVIARSLGPVLLVLLLLIGIGGGFLYLNRPAETLELLKNIPKGKQ